MPEIMPNSHRIETTAGALRVLIAFCMGLGLLTGLCLGMLIGMLWLHL